jgi:hypothetical protein
MKTPRFILVAALALFGLAGNAQNGAYLHSSRHFYAPTGRTIPQDSIYLNWVGPLLDINFGITEKFSAGIGTPLFTGVYLTGSYGGALNEVGTINGRVGNLTGFPVVGEGYYSLPYGVMTFGTPEHEITLGTGYFFMSNGLTNELFGTNADELDPSSAVINVGSYQQLNNRLGFAFEGWYLAETDWLVLMPGVRFYTQRNRKYWNVGIIRLRFPYIDDQGYWDPNTNEWIENPIRKIQNITLPMFSFATYL